MKLIRVNNYQEMSRMGAKEIIKFVNKNPQGVLGLATGSSPIGLYKELVSDYQQNSTNYAEITSFNLDEYVGIDKNNPQSYYYFMMQHLFQHINIKENNINIPNGSAKDLKEECESYEDKLRFCPIDIQILGIGANGHIGFNEPGTSVNSRVHIAELDKKTRIDNARFFYSLEEVPTYAITMGIKNIMEAKKIILLAYGEEKAQAVYSMLKGDVTEKMPASILRKHPNITIIADHKATVLLDALGDQEASV